MNRQQLLIAAAVLIVAAFILITWGLEKARWMWLTGLALAALAFIAALVFGWAPEKGGDEENDEQE